MAQTDLKNILSEHKTWLKTNGKKGKRANLEGFDLKGGSFFKVELQKARLCRANLKRAYLGDANLEAADLEGANLQDANLESANLSSANLKYANLKYASLDGTDLSGANLRNANLEEAELEDAILTNANLQGANLEKACLCWAEIDDANLIDANLKDAKLNGASFDGACLDGANLSGTDFNEAITDDTDLENWIQRDGEDSVTMKKVKFDSNILEKAKSKFIETVITAINQEQIKGVVGEKYSLASINGINIKNGDILSYNNQIAFRLEFETTILLSCVLDSEGNLIDGVSQIAPDISKDTKEKNSSYSEI